MSNLNGAYYGPAVPPPKSYHRPSRSSGCGCCCGCLFSLIFKIIITIVIIVGIAVFLFWLIVRPNKVKVNVTEATLTQFNYTTNNTLYYNLSLNITIRNPNKRLGIYYDYIEAQPFYHDARFDLMTLEPFYQGHKTTNELNAAFKGQHVIVLGADQISELDKEKISGVYDIEVKIYLKIRFKLGVLKTGKMKPNIDCDLKVPLTTSNNGNSIDGSAFQTTKCDWGF
ncbi:hypothetical protein Lal_00023006 [Lupinus albus]|uniref:Putative Late embryogenesis abundant protein, LEA-14 n=1 Tax=Lupinus albus TaxID=3870 RepID=A0A6A5N167_LUPAL|nr:putative Late embryogenesis abundant protein, LEA-14 [Lupinus albus]KAF1880976.1 hypothetical protein Lal_00023006 [Lupinus albus]